MIYLSRRIKKAIGYFILFLMASMLFVSYALASGSWMSALIVLIVGTVIFFLIRLAYHLINSD